MPNPVVYAKGADLDALDFVAGTGKHLDGAVLRLFRNNIAPDRDTLLGGFTPSIADGVTTSDPIVWGDAYLDDADIPSLSGASLQFMQTGDTGDTCYGWYMVGAPGGSEYLIAARRFDDPVTFDGAGRGHIVDPLYQIPRGKSTDIAYHTVSQEAILTQILAATGPWNAAKMNLFKQVTDPDADTLYAAFTVPVFTGAGLSIALVYGTTFVDENGVATAAPPSVLFRQTATTATDTARGWFVIGDPSGTPFVIASQLFDATVHFDTVGRGRVVVPALQIN